MVNLKLTDTGELLIIEGQTFPVELNSTAFSDVIPGSRVYEIKLPVEANEKALEFANHIEINTTIKAYDIELLQEGIPKVLGKLNIRKFDEKYFYGSIVVNPFAQDIGVKSLKEMPWPSDFLLGFNTAQIISAAKTESQKLWPDANFAFPSYMAPNFYGNRTGNWGGVVNAYDSANNKYFNNTILGGAEHNDNLYAIAPMLYLRFILKIVFEENGYQLNGSWVNDELMNHCLWFSNYALDKVPDETFKAETINNEWLNLDITLTDIAKTIYTPIVIVDPQSCISQSSATDPLSGLSFNTTIYKVKTSGTIVFTLSIDEIDRAMIPTYEFIPDSIIDTFYFTLKNGTQNVDLDTVTYSNFDPLNSVKNLELTLQALDNGTNINDDLFIYVKRVVEWSEKSGLNVTQHSKEYEVKLKGIKLKIRNNQYSTFNEFGGVVHYKNHVQDLKVSKFLLDLRDFFGLIIKFNYKKKAVTIDWLNDMFSKSPVKMKGPYAKGFNPKLEVEKGFTLKLDISENEEEIPNPDDHNYLGEFAGPFNAPAPKMGDMMYSFLYNAYYLTQLNAQDNVEWYKKAWNYSPLILGDGSVQKSPGISPLLMDNVLMGGNNFLLPYYKEQGSSPVFEIGITEPKPKLVYYFGFQNSGGSHPFATSLERLPDYSVHNLPRLTWDYHYRSIFMLKLKSWYDFLLNSKEVEKRLLITDQEIEEYDFAQPELIDGVVYIRKQLLYEIANQWPNRARVTLLKL